MITHHMITHHMICVRQTRTAHQETKFMDSSLSVTAQTFTFHAAVAVVTVAVTARLLLPSTDDPRDPNILMPISFLLGRPPPAGGLREVRGQGNPGLGRLY